ncbi:reverse transcriptase family protein [Paracoccus sp. DMF-8]|uniref:reverse transcriptase family protein n=1 Tax=Paracoccus sp. DMF-8 TaxID=3019445 RepID=UPI0023E795EB|nr:reverse transcriptase family protein [Paracoccus sp. DMF-8]MDF3606703.1 reverse transcriptase family protein [Paracoccus sp. DMF-8]
MIYQRDQSALYKISSPQMLADRLLISMEDLEGLLHDPDPYKRWIDKKTGRAIQEPRPRLACIHRRIALLLSRIATPDYLHSARKGRSYITNASVHGVETRCAKIDVRKFYPSARAQAVYHFFLDRMACAGDVAGMLSKLLTVDGHLPTGSSASPILSFFAYEDMFDELSILAANAGCVMTVYVDDIVFSGHGAGRRIIYAAKKIIRSRHLHGHKTKVFRSGQPRIVTGAAVTSAGLRLPNRRQRSIAQDQTLFENLLPSREKLVVARRLAGRLYEASQIDPGWRSSADRMAAQRDALHFAFGR